MHDLINGSLYWLSIRHSKVTGDVGGGGLHTRKKRAFDYNGYLLAWSSVLMSSKQLFMTSIHYGGCL